MVYTQWNDSLIVEPLIGGQQSALSQFSAPEAKLIADC